MNTKLTSAPQAEPQPEIEQNAARYVWLREHLSTTLLRELTPQTSGLYHETCATHLDDVIDEQIDEEKTKKPIKVFGLITMDKKQQALIQAHCFGDCGKASMAGAIMDDQLGGLMVCCEVVCPWLGKEMAEPYGTTMSFGEPHEVYLRALSETPATLPKAAP